MNTYSRQECDFGIMGENIHQLTSLPYSNFEDEHSEDADGQPDHVPNLHVSNSFKMSVEQ